MYLHVDTMAHDARKGSHTGRLLVVNRSWSNSANRLIWLARHVLIRP